MILPSKFILSCRQPVCTILKETCVPQPMRHYNWCPCPTSSKVTYPLSPSLSSGSASASVSLSSWCFLGRCGDAFFLMEAGRYVSGLSTELTMSSMLVSLPGGRGRWYGLSYMYFERFRWNFFKWYVCHLWNFDILPFCVNCHCKLERGGVESWVI